MNFSDEGLHGDPYKRVVEAELALEAMPEITPDDDLRFATLVTESGTAVSTPSPEMPDMRAHRLASAAIARAKADGQGIYNAIREVLIEEFDK